MKKVINAAYLMIFCVVFLAMPGRVEDKNMSLSVDPISLISGSIPLTFGIRLADKFSLGLTGYDKFFSLSKTSVQGVGGGLSGKFHLSSHALNDGWYVKPEVMAGYWSIGEGESKSKGLGLEPRLVAGYDWVWSSGLVLGLGLGIKYSYFSGNKAEVKDALGFGFHEFFPNADLTVGWAF